MVLTALHCTRGTSANRIRVLFGPDDANPLGAIRAASKREHPELDLALLELTAAPAATLNVEPIPIALTALGAADVGITLEQAGYGRTQSGSSDGRFFVAERLDGFEDAFHVVNGEGQRGVCFGDSGGPSMVTDDNGGTRVVGALSWGDESCVGRDRYTQVGTAEVRAWIEQSTGPTPGAGPVVCGSVTSEGRCSGSGMVASWCQDAVLTQQACAAGEVCGWNTNEAGWRCVAEAADPCEGVGFRGACDGQTLSWCDRGERKQRDCAACGERCVLRDENQGYACVASDCGELTFEGRCNGGTAEWCTSEGTRDSRDCAADGRSCGYTGQQNGFFCLPTACGTTDYRGRCDGDVAVWCQNGRLNSRNCASQGATCSLVNDEVGYFCTTP